MMGSAASASAPRPVMSPLEVQFCSAWRCVQPAACHNIAPYVHVLLLFHSNTFCCDALLFVEFLHIIVDFAMFASRQFCCIPSMQPIKSLVGEKLAQRCAECRRAVHLHACLADLRQLIVVCGLPLSFSGFPIGHAQDYS